MNNVTIKLTAKTSQFTAPNLIAVLKKMRLDRDGIHVDNVKDAKVLSDGAFTFDLQVSLDEDGKLRDVENFQIDIYSIENFGEQKRKIHENGQKGESSRQFIMSTGPLNDLADDLNQLNITELLKAKGKAEIIKVIYLTPAGYSLSCKIPTMIEQFDAVINRDETLNNLLKGGSKNKDIIVKQLREVIADHVKLKYLCRKISTKLMRQADANDLDKAAALHPSQWFSPSMVRRYLFAQIFEKLHEIHQYAWFAIFTGSERLADDNALLILNEVYVHQRIEQGIDEQLVPNETQMANGSSDHLLQFVTRIAELANSKRKQLVSNNGRRGINEIQCVLAYLKEGFDDLEYDFNEAKAHIVDQLKKKPSSGLTDYKSNRKDILEALIDYIASREMDKQASDKVKRIDRRLSQDIGSTEKKDKGKLIDSVSHLIKGKLTSALPQIQTISADGDEIVEKNKEKLKEHHALVNKISKFVGKQQYRMTEYYSVSNALLSNFSLLDHVVNIKKKASIGGTKIKKLSDLSTVDLNDWKSWMDSTPQREIVLKHLGYSDDDLSDTKKNIEFKKALESYASSSHELLGRLFPNQHFVAASRRFGLSDKQQNALKLATNFLSGKYGNQINITSFSPTCWQRIEDRLEGDNLSPSDRSRIENEIREVKAWQLAHSILPDKKDHIKTAKLKGILGNRHQDEAGRNPIKDLLLMGEVRFIEEWIKIESPDPDNSSALVKQFILAAEAKAIYKKAKRQIYYSFMTQTSGNQQSMAFSTIAPGPGVIQTLIGGYSPSVNNAVSWDSLFCTKDNCECAHAESVLSPAAYVMDQLNWLNTITGYADGQNLIAKDLLLEKRPDLIHIALSKNNTLTSLPYIDIVNEVLERQVYDGLQLFSNPQNIFADNDRKVSRIETSGSSEERERQAEIIQKSIFDNVYEENLISAQGIHLPYDIWLDSARLWLKKIKTEIHELLYFTSGEYTVTEKADGKISAVRDFGLSPSPGDGTNVIVRGALDSIFDGEYFNLSFGEKRLITHEGYSSSNVYGAKLPHIGKDIPALIEILVAQLQLEGQKESQNYALFLEILATRFVQATAVDNKRVQIHFMNDNCSLAKGNAELINFSSDTYKNLFVFCKLLGKLRWRPWQLDWVISQNDMKLDEKLIRDIALALRIKDALDISLLDMLAICFGHYTDRYKDDTEPEEEDKHKIIFNSDKDWEAPLLSLIASLESLSVASQEVGRAYSYWKPGDSSPESFFIYSSIRSSIAQHFKVTEQEIDAVASILNIASDTEITPIHLQNIHKLAVTANAVEVPLETLCQLPELRETFTLGDISNFLMWILQLQSCREVVSNYLVMVDLFDSDQHLLPLTDNILTARYNHQKQLNQILKEFVHFFAMSNTENVVKKHENTNSGYTNEIAHAVSNILMHADVEGITPLIKSLLGGSNWPQLDGVTSKYLFDVEKKEIGETINTLGEYTSGHFILIPATDLSIKINPAVPDSTDSCTIESVFQAQPAVNENLFHYQLSKDITYLVTVSCNSKFEIEVQDLRSISNVDCWYFPSKMPLAAGGSFDLDRKVFVSLFTGALEPSEKLLWLLKEFDLSDKDLNYLSMKTEIGALPLNNLLNRKLTKNDLVSALYRLATYAMLKKSVNSIDCPSELMDGSILPYDTGSSPVIANDRYVQLLSRALKVDSSDIKMLLNANDLKSATVFLAGNNEPLYKLYNSLPELLLTKVVAWIRKFKSAPSAIQYLLNVSAIEWVVDPDVLDSTALIDKKRAHRKILLGVGKFLGNDKWLESQQSMEDQLRLGRRDALVDYLLSGNAFKHPRIGRKYQTVEEVSRELLIPVDIAPCRKTSRVREAISAIQRFVQLCKLGHIKGIYLSESNLDEWDTFRQAYRIWEVNRKIMLFPDEYLLPNLRIQKTPLFSQAESELEQDEATRDSAETVVNNYVRSLHEISNLEVVALLNHTVDTGEHITLIIARTRSNPHEYYFCSSMTYLDNRNWTPWYNIAIDIEGDHLLPAIHNGYLYLFWPSIKVVTDKTAKEKEPEYKENDDKNPQKFEVKLNYTRLDVVIDNQFPQRVKWGKKKQSKDYVEVRIEYDEVHVEKLNLAEEKYRVHMLSSVTEGTMYADLNIDIGYWESLPEEEALELHWDDQVLAKAFTDIQNILENEMEYEFVSGNMRIEITTEGDNVPNTGWGFLDDVLEGGADAIAGAANTVVSIYNLPSPGQVIKNSQYRDKVLQLFLHGPEMSAFWAALEGGDRESAADHLEQLKSLAADLDSGKNVQLTATINSYIQLTEKVKVKVKTGFSLEDIVKDLRLNINLVYENSYGSQFQLYKKGRFVLNACGDLHIKETDTGDLNEKVYLSERHETPETSILNQRLYQDKGNRLSIYENKHFSSELFSESKQVIFNNTPTKFALVTDPKNIPFRVSDRGLNNFVFQDANHLFLVIPSISPGGLFEEGPFSHLGAYKEDYYYEPHLRGQYDLSGFLRADYGVRSDSKGHLKNLIVVKVDSGSRKKNAQLLFNSGDKLSASVSAIVQDKNAGKVLSYAAGIPSKKSNIYKTKFQQIDEESFALSSEGNASVAVLVKDSTYKLLPLHHSSACAYLNQMSVSKKGVHFLLLQMGHQGEIPWGVFTISLFGAGPYQYNVISTTPVDYSEAERSVYFDKGHLFSAYNHELFFHLPFLIAVNFSDNGRYEDAYKWFHYIFDPRSKSGKRSENEVWGFLPFKQESEAASLQDRVAVSIADPFNPHAIAQIDQNVYKKAVFYKYIDNLIAWADSQYILYTGESLDRAENLYRDVLRLLGRRPMEVIKAGIIKNFSYSQLYIASVDSGDGFDVLGNVAIEDIPDETIEENWNSSAINEVVLAATLPENYFCRPGSEKINEYFVLVQQRLFNLNHCRDINGNLREIPLFQPPISPWLLVRARAAGLDIGSVLSYQADAAGYRWEFLQQKATEYTEFAARLADKLQSAMEKRDAAVLTELRESHQKELLKKTRLIRRMNIKDAEIHLQQLERVKESIEFRQEYYAGRPRVISAEREEVEKNKQAFGFDMVAQSIETLTAALAVIPQIGAHMGIPFGASTTFGGQHLAQAGRAIASGARLGASILRHESYLAGVSANRQRRYDDWQFQAKSATKELRQVDQQILSATLRINISEQELENIELQLEQSEIVVDVLKNQFSNEEFYEWQVMEVMKLYRSAYYAAFDMAKRAEATYLRDTMQQDDRIIEAGNWSSERKGLGGTEKLLSQLKQLDESYWLNINPVNQVSKRLSVSLALNFPEQLAELKTFGECDLDIKGFIFDVHWPDHYFRRIKSVSITIPCIKGPYHPINARLTLTKSNIRTKAETVSYEDNYDNYLNNFKDVFFTFAETNDATQDTGRLQFDDGNRLLNAFEGAGLDHSKWKLQLSREFNKIDFSTISDVIITFEYTARRSVERGNSALLDRIKAEIEKEIKEVKQIVSVKGFFSQPWSAFINQIAGASDVIIVNAMVEKLTGISVNSLTSPTLKAYFVLENENFNASTVSSCDIVSNDYDDASQGKISLKTIWDKCPADSNDNDVSKDRLKDILLYYSADRP